MFHVFCCGKRRGLINGVIVCGICDYDHSKATVIPNEHAAKDVPDGARMFTPTLVGEPGPELEL